MDPRIADDPVYGPQLRDSFAALPILSLSGGDGIWQLYADPQARGRAVEQPIAVEFFDPQDREPGFAVDAGARIQGGAGRWEFMPKHSFRLFFRSDYGAPQLRYPFFPDSPAQEYNTLVLRAGSDRGYAGHPPAPETVQDHRQDLYARDQWARESQLAMNGVGVHGRPVHLFLNGLYWGIYTVVERPDDEFWATYFGGAPADYGVASHSGPVDGPQDRFNVLMQLAAAGGLDDPARYATMLEFVDPVQFADYLILNWTMGNTDWPENNWYVGAQYPAGRNLFLAWDAEMTWIDGAAIVLGGDGWEGAPYPNVIKQVFTALMGNPDFRMLLADRLYALTAQGAPLDDAVAQARLRDITAELAPAMVAESARWGDVRTETPITPDDWAAARADVLAQMDGNGAKLRALARDAGFYAVPDPPVFDHTDPIFDAPFALAMDAPAGDIFYTLDGSDPRAPGGDTSPAALRYVDPVPVDDAVWVHARARDGAAWSPLQTAFFHRPDQRSDVRITELMYNPLDGEQYEFVELTNLGQLPADLSGAFFNGIDFHFPWYRTLAPGASIAIVADFRRFRERYPEAEIGGIFTGKLSDRGERIALFAQDGTLIDAVTYEDAAGWPSAPTARAIRWNWPTPPATLTTQSTGGRVRSYTDRRGGIDDAWSVKRET
ncbi:MAG: CotH kinase family protein [Caldilineaceae bacterium]